MKTAITIGLVLLSVAAFYSEPDAIQQSARHIFLALRPYEPHWPVRRLVPLNQPLTPEQRRQFEQQAEPK